MLQYIDHDTATDHVSLDPHCDAFVQNPYAAYEYFHRYARSFFWTEYGFWCFAGFDDVNRLLRDRRFGRENRWNDDASAVNRSHLADFDRVDAHSMLELEPPAHTRLRGLVNRAFVSRSIERLRPRVEALAHELIDQFEGDRSAELLSAFATPVPIVVITEMLGLPRSDGDQLLDWSHAMVAMYAHGHTDAEEHLANRAAAEFTLYLHKRIAERRRNPGDDLLSQLIAARDENGRLSEQELISSTILLLNAGHEATVHQAGNAIRTIMRQDGDPRRFFASPEQTEATVEECLRIDPPLHMFTRYAYEEVDLGGGLTIRPGEKVGLLLGAANRDTEAYEAPHEFLPARQDQKNTTFGAGIHFCIGAPLARLELQTSLKVLFDRIPALKISAEPRYHDSYHFHGLASLRADW